ncbi:Putative uncharacterized protein [Moritella viscosa]|uniref:restriction endonuclease n=1 Tax=Moritella viscosa TaxID=80854 RepID=UPI00091A55B1|nr:restriction endonuclease [Moritella viscosa]SGZ09769.1 Putative uncharacterized protein [Moritella viscosa]
MIENPDIKDWKQLQNAVCRLFNEAGLTAKTEVRLKTPRGMVEVDVFALDERSVDKIRYVVECKNWSNSIPQHVVHAFTSVMHETGANIGFIVSKAGLQSGAEQYTRNTNITGLTFEALQHRYFEPWWYNYFCVKVAAAAENVCFYTEPHNTRRNEALERLTDQKLDKFYLLRDKYAAFSMLMWHADIGTIAPSRKNPVPNSISEYKGKFVEILGYDFSFSADYWRELLDEICEFLSRVETELHELFGRNVFERT